MEDYLVIIITLIVAVVGVLRRKKKKTVAQAPETGKAKSSSNFWDMIMDEQGGDAEPVYEYEESESHHVDPEPVLQEHAVAVEKSSSAFWVRDEGVSAVDTEREATQKKKRKITIDGEEFSLKKAVIYSEIMNRKYS